MENLVLLLVAFATITALPSVRCAADDPATVTDWFRRLPEAKEKTTRLHFYFHDIVSGKNPTAVTVAKSPSTDKSPTLFGLVNMMDNPLTAGPDLNSKLVGRAQGIYGSAGQHSLGLLMTLNFVFTGKKFNGSTLSVLGRNPVFETYREMPIVGGTGAFRLARGIATAKTHTFNSSGDAIVEPMCRTVSDAVDVLDVIVGFDPHDARATRAAAKFVPRGGYKQFLKPDGLRGKRLGIIRNPFFNFPKGSLQSKVYEQHFTTLRKQGAILVDNLAIDGSYSNSTSEVLAMTFEFKVALNAYLKDLVSSPVRSLEDVIDFNNRHKAAEKIKEYGQQLFELAQMTTGTDDPEYILYIQNLASINRNKFVKFMKRNELDSVVTPGSDVTPILAIGGHPGISVPAGYGADGVPLGICFGGLRGSEPKLIEIAYAFEQATKIRRPPPMF